MSQLITYSGTTLDLLSPQPETIDSCDIAHALSQICCFNGHSREFYSLAQRCCLISDLVEPQHKLAALLMEAPAAYVGNPPRPLKKMIGMYREIEEELWQAICQRFGLYPMLPDSVREAELIVLAAELRDLLNVPMDRWHLPAGPGAMAETITPWTPKHARSQYLDRLFSLMTDPPADHLTDENGQSEGHAA
ncbi:phosphohydrolase [Pseudomonas sp. 21LCFQ010]|uniref:phosphohydrolase n=1 Tax=Pseudomonas sp. 21LCFQ010 TaxID=2957506 RepID=UPI0020979494|nr:phosphohydrolase [Pseudomonas sp. 21LCFQ010]MCO8164815.1 phosphohydrolase [Pseudomonas sp. 21LCFQ010]